MNRPVNERQLEVLRWIVAGCPEGKWADDDNLHKISAAALKSRGLATVTGHGRTWTAMVTDAGTYYLEHGNYPPSATPPATVTAGRRARREKRPNLDLSEGASKTLSEGERPHQAAPRTKATHRPRPGGVSPGALSTSAAHMQDPPPGAGWAR